MKKIILTILSISLFSCVKDSNYDAPNTQELIQQNTKRYNEYDRNNIISYNNLRNKVTSTIATYTDDNAFEGYVISSDEGGNFYKEIYVQALDKSGTIAVAIDKKGLYSEFPIGSKVQVRLKGTSVWNDPRYSIIKVGYGERTTSAGNKRISNLPSAMYENVIIPSGEKVNIEDITTTLESLNDVKSNANIYKLVYLKNVHFDTNAVGKTFHNPTDQYDTSYNIIDAQGGTLPFATSSFATYIKDLIPSGNLNIRGIVTRYGQNTYTLKISNLTDIQTAN
ncbi:MAG: DUF5689 domain-containing protein [Capnocytophaga sp.]|nr:DUF5689 domain-containing protein [Capnocytophaga sp.]